MHTVGKNNEIEIKIEVIKMTINEIRELIPGATIMRNDVIYMSLDADDDYRYDVTIAFTLKESGIMRIHGFCSDLKISGDKVSDAILFCNKYNKDYSFTQVYCDMSDHDFNASWAFDTSNMSDAAIRENIKLVITAIWRFFVEVGKEF